MPLQNSGQITIDDLRTEFSATGTRGLSDFYRGGTFVPDTPANSGVPASGQIQLSDFYGADATPASIGPAFTAFRTFNNSRTTDTITSDGQLVINSIPIGTYIVEGLLLVQSASTSSPGNFQFRLTAPGSTTQSVVLAYGVPEQDNDAPTDPILSVGTTMGFNMTGLRSTNIVGVDNQVYYSIWGSMNTSVVGTLELSWAQDTQETGNATTLLAGSWLQVWEVT